MSNPTEQLTAQQTADRLGVSTRTLGRYVAAGLITPRRRTPRGPRLFEPGHVDALARGECVECGSHEHTRHP